MRWIAALFWVCFGMACLSYAAGNPTAANGMFGAGLGAVVATSLAFIEGRS